SSLFPSLPPLLKKRNQGQLRDPLQRLADKPLKQGGGRLHVVSD
uniref:Uncharacterized protein n=1 Tax=Ciona savignyi TaxID=51511 RepID=H2ZCL2_CIOSA